LRQPDDVVSETIGQDCLIDLLRQQSHHQQNDANDDEFRKQTGAERPSDTLAVRLIEHEPDFARAVRLRTHGQMGRLNCCPLRLFALGRRCH